MRPIFTKANLKKSISLVLLSLGISGIGLGSWIKIQTTLALREAPQPEAILMLGGTHNREPFTAQFAAQQESPLDIWVSTGVDSEQARAIFQEAGIPEERVHLDREAIDTITNFTTLVDDLRAKDIDHVYLITSDFHMPRSKAIATLILARRREAPRSTEGERRDERREKEGVSNPFLRNQKMQKPIEKSMEKDAEESG